MRNMKYAVISLVKDGIPIIVRITIDDLDIDIFEPRDCKQRYQAAEEFMKKLLEPLANSNDATYSQISCAVSELKEEC